MFESHSSQIDYISIKNLIDDFNGCSSFIKSFFLIKKKQKNKNWSKDGTSNERVDTNHFKDTGNSHKVDILYKNNTLN